jgi:hypothetical protein
LIWLIRWPFSFHRPAAVRLELKRLRQPADVLYMDIILSAAATGIGAASERLSRVAERVASSVPELRAVVRDTVEIAGVRVAARAGAAVVRTASEVLGSVVDLFA